MSTGIYHSNLTRRRTMSSTFSVSRAEFEELAKNGTITLTRTYGTHWRKRIKEEFGIEINGIKGQDKTYHLTDQGEPPVCVVQVNPTPDHGFVVLTAIRVYQKEDSSKIILELSLVWSDALNTHMDVADAMEDINRWFRENLWLYAVIGLSCLTVLFIIIKMLV